MPWAIEMFSRTSQHALNVLGLLASDQRGRVPGDDLATRTGVPSNYLSKILNQLRKQGIVEAEKGRGGGFRLRPEALDRPIRDILAIFEGTDPQQDARCAFGLDACDPAKPCPLHAYWEQIRQVRQAMLTEVKVRDLVQVVR